jgi:uncharacterized protein with PQ loop repeat
MTEENIYLRSIVIIANIIGFIYNIPQVILTIRTKSTDDISAIFLILRLISATLWLIYTSIIWSPDVFVSWIITDICKKKDRIEIKDDQNSNL